MNLYKRSNSLFLFTKYKKYVNMYLVKETSYNKKGTPNVCVLGEPYILGKSPNRVRWFFVYINITKSNTTSKTIIESKINIKKSFLLIISPPNIMIEGSPNY